ncbi:hypothetical protein J2T13_000927 [Paenibacillus sp. DS2015]|uniref:hypothetical protein n=1 Tax=Paenibacillus sp. DS2015 TaxID=3373917 RepID=UPI003D1AFBC5
MRKIFAFILIFSLLLPTGIIGAKSAQYTAKLYPQLNLIVDAKKFPMKLNNGLVIDKENGDMGVFPVIKLNGKKVWSGKNEFEGSGEVQFTVTASGDTYLYSSYYHGASGPIGIDFVGVHANGRVFVKKKFGGDTAVPKFLKADSFELAIERSNPKWDPSKDSNAELHTGIYDVTIYQLTTKGIVKQKQFVRK